MKAGLVAVMLVACCVGCTGPIKVTRAVTAPQNTVVNMKVTAPRAVFMQVEADLSKVDGIPEQVKGITVKPWLVIGADLALTNVTPIPIPTK